MTDTKDMERIHRARTTAKLMFAEVPERKPDALSTRELALMVLVGDAGGTFGRGFAIKEIRDIFGLGQSATSDLVRILARKGYIQTKPDPFNHTHHLVGLTAKGLRLRQARRGDS